MQRVISGTLQAMPPGAGRKTSNCFLAVAILACVFQLLWFGSKCFNQIDYDGMAYTGIARHLHLGEFHAATNAFRSPLMSWLIAALSFVRSDYLHIGKLVNIFSFLLAAFLLYIFTLRLWNSRLAASASVLLFVLARGYAFAAVAFVVPDFLFAALGLVYFIVLIRCLREDLRTDWILLGLVHAVAFLAKGFALPWLAFCTFIAVVVSNPPNRARIKRLASAALIPVLMAAAWATVLHSKYGAFTTGTQFKANLLQWTLRAFRDHRDETYLLLRNTSKEVDEYGVDDPMPPGSWTWTYPIHLKEVIPKVALTEERILPQVIKEIVIVVTPGGVLAFIATFVVVIRRRSQYPAEWRLMVVIAAGVVSLICAYSMLVFDARYLFPLTPLVLAVAARFLVPDDQCNLNGWRKLCVALVLIGVAASLVYKSSPFRVATRDFQVLCYEAGHDLKEHRIASVVSVGTGPYPEHGVGWEAGYKAAYFGGSRIIGTMESLPDLIQISSLMADVRKASPEAILVWGRPGDARYTGLVRSVRENYSDTSNASVDDPVLGEVGTVLFIPRRSGLMGQ